MSSTDSKLKLEAFQSYLNRVDDLLKEHGQSSNGLSSTSSEGGFHAHVGKLHTPEERENESLPLTRIVQKFGLSEFETDILLLCFAAAASTSVRRELAKLNGHPDRDYVTHDLAVRLLDVPRDQDEILQEMLAIGGPLRSGQILACGTPDASADGIMAPLFLEQRITSYLMGSEKLDMWNRRYMRDLNEREPALFDSSVRERILLFSQQNRNARQTEMVYVFGPEGAGHEAAAGLIAEDCSHGLIVFRTAEFLQLSPDWARRALKIAVRESRLLNRCLFIPEIESILDSPLASILRGVLAEIFFDEIYMPALIFGGEGVIDAKHFSEAGRCFVIELKIPSVARRAEIWDVLLKDHDPLEADITVEELAGRYKFTPGQIRTALNFARYESIGRGAASGLSRSDLVTGCRMSSNRKLTELAKRIDMRFTWDQLILSENLMTQVRNVAQSYRQISAFFEDWDFGNRFKYGKGISALFGGASGTGKTMAASVIASELDLELYKIDLSRVVSKFIGETEKNLAKIFKEAETSNAILFFDEADALFGKRSEVKDAHDRHANIEIDFLLQQMEEYDGLTILATNLSQNIDEAFTRRLQFIINFTKPKVAERERIWRGMFPEKAPVNADVDFALLAQNVELAGGGIKNIIFTAGMMALDEGSDICMRHLIRGVKIEYLKENIPFIAANFGPHAQS
jgi:SpoVK/Ycf46/Vps4 family AAA+-type ATPase